MATGVLLTGSELAGVAADPPALARVGLDRAAGSLDRTAGSLDRAAGNDVSRGLARTGPTVPPSSAPSAQVAGLDPAQTANAAVIVAVARRHGLPARAMVIGIATALQESDLRNVASTAVPESLRYPHDGIAVDHDSVGLFQQRGSQGWGSLAELMDPEHSAGLFFDRLAQVPGWQSMSVTGAAQAVQRSAFPDAYQKHQPRAETVIAALTN